MTDNNYPPLPEHVDEHPHTGVRLFSEQQMHAYIDADRAQRKPLTDEWMSAIRQEFWWMHAELEDVETIVRATERYHGINPPAPAGCR